MNQTILIAFLPMIIGTLLYVLQSVGYAWMLQRPGMAVAMFAYAIANCGLIYDALTTVNK